LQSLKKNSLLAVGLAICFANRIFAVYRVCRRYTNVMT